VHDTWAARDLPVLEATVSLLEQSFMVTVTDIAVRTGLEPSDVARALAALDPVYVDFRKTTTGGDARYWYVFKVTPEARRVVGQWPTAEALAGRLAEELSAAARRETDGERQGLLTYAARLIGDTLRDATVQAAAAVLAPAFGGVPQPELGRPLPTADPPAADPPSDDPPSADELAADAPKAAEPVLDSTSAGA
jgi:predicted transcriptional regulator